MTYRAIKGTKDILPAEALRWQHVESVIREVFRRYNYREIRTPVFEQTSLFARSIGELTDIVGKEMYTFEDRGGESVTLKPEGTASVVRAYIQNNLGEAQPLVKLYYLAPMFRQERPQAGRLRQFHQFGAEAIGSPHPEVDAEIIAMSMDVYRLLGVESCDLRINSVGCEECRPRYRKALQDALRAIAPKLSADSQRRLESNPMRILDSKDENDRALTASMPRITDYLCADCAAHHRELKEALGRFGLTYIEDPRLVRGLDYYTKTAYELTSSDLGSQDALAGGGRYDLLTKELGGASTPAVGFAAGIERLLMVLDKKQYQFPDNARPDLFIAAADEQGRRWATATAVGLRRAGCAVETDLLRRSLKAQMREADRQRARYVLVAGEAEITSGSASLKDMEHSTQRTILISELAEAIRSTIPDPPHGQAQA